MATAALNRYTPEEYLALERHAEFKSEYIDGRIIAMTGAQRPHNLVAGAVASELERHLLESPCEMYPGDMRVKISESGDYVYPDVVVSCEPKFEDENFDNLLTPLLIIEVLSDSTEHYDRGKKFGLYRRIESLREYVLISQKEPVIERYLREGEFWQFSTVDGLDASLLLASVGLQIPMRRLYAKALTPADRVPRAATEDASQGSPRRTTVIPPLNPPA
jgi:Uma2 family endonuclease